MQLLTGHGGGVSSNGATDTQHAHPYTSIAVTAIVQVSVVHDLSIWCFLVSLFESTMSSVTPDWALFHTCSDCQT